MGTGGGGGGKKGGNGGKKLPEDKVEMGGYPNKGEEDDSSSETSLKLDVNPQQLASVGLNRPLINIEINTKEKSGSQLLLVGVVTPPSLGGGTETVSPQRRTKW